MVQGCHPWRETHFRAGRWHPKAALVVRNVHTTLWRRLGDGTLPSSMRKAMKIHGFSQEINGNYLQMADSPQLCEITRGNAQHPRGSKWIYWKHQRSTTMFVIFFPVKRIFLEINPGFITGPQYRLPIWDTDATAKPLSGKYRGKCLSSASRDPVIEAENPHC